MSSEPVPELSENPHVSDKDAVSQVTEREPCDNSHRVAVARRYCLLAVLGYLCIVPMNILFTQMGEELPFGGILLITILFSIFTLTAFSIYRLAALLQGPRVASILAIAGLLPLIGLISLLYVLTLKTEPQHRQCR